MRSIALTMTKATCTSLRDMHYNEAWQYSDACLYGMEAEADADYWGPGRWTKKKN